MFTNYRRLYVFLLLVLSIDFSFLGLYLQTHPLSENKSTTGLSVAPLQMQPLPTGSVPSSLNDFSSSQQSSLTPMLGQSPSIHQPTTSPGVAKNVSSSADNSLIGIQSSTIFGGTSYSWANTSFSFRKLLTINHTMISGTSALTNFPVLVNIYDADLRSNVQSNGNDIIFTNASGTRLAFELQTFNQTYNSTHAHLVAWILVPSLSPTIDTNIFMYYGNPTMGKQQTPTAVWDTTYNAVYHFETDPTQTVPESTNHFNATPTGMISTDLVPGYINNGYSFVGSNYLSTGSVSTTINSFTLSSWFHVSSTSSNRPLITMLQTTSSPCSSSSPCYKELYIEAPSFFGNPNIAFYYEYGTSSSDKSFNYDIHTSTSWYYLVLTYNSTYLNLYVNGTFVQAISVSMNQLSNIKFQIGYASPSGSYFRGTIDEPRISNIARSTAWIATEFNNQKSGTKYYHISSEDKLVYNLQYREKITLDHTKISGTSSLTNFPLLLDFYDTNLHTKAQASGNDIMFGDANGLKYNHQIEAFYQNYNATHAHLLVWVQVPSLSALVDTVLYMYYGNTTMSTLQSAHQVWTNNYQAVWHLDEPSTTYMDSTGHGYNGTQNGNTQVTGLLDYGQYFSGSSQFIQIPSTFNPAGDLTFSGWFKLDSPFTSTTQTSLVLFAKYSNNENNMHVALAGTDYKTSGVSDGALVFEIDKGRGITEIVWTQQTSWSAGVWYYFTLIINSNNAPNNKIFINGLDNTYPTDSGSASTIDLAYGGVWGIGGGQVDTAYIPTSPRYFTGTFDEFQVASGMRSTDWINTSYHNQLNPRSFFTLGTEQNIYPAVQDFGVDDPGTGHPQFWANITRGWTRFPIINVTLLLNGTKTNSMTLNMSGFWVYNLSVAHFNDYYTYQIISATDALGNSLLAPTNIRTVRFNVDKTIPTVLAWTYDPTVGINGTFHATVSDSWGIISTVMVTVTSCPECSVRGVSPVPQVMKFDGIDYINNSMSLIHGSINFIVTVNDTSGNTFTTTEHTGYLPNRAPSVSNIVLSPTPVRSNDTLLLTYTYFDPDIDPESGTQIRWYKNYVLQPNLNNLRIIGPGNTTKNELWYFTITVSDGVNYSSMYISNTIQILNTAPTASNVLITPAHPAINTSLTAEWNFADSDGDSESVNWYIRWYRNGVPQISYDNKRTIPAFTATKGENWSYILRVSDGVDYSSVYYSNIVTIVNTAPTASNVIITPSHPDRTDILVASYVYYDLDGDPENVSQRIIWWYLNYVHLDAYDNDTSIPSSLLIRNQVWYYKLWVYDGQNNSISFQTSNTVTIVNSIPTIVSATFNDTTVYINDTVAVSYNCSDADNDPMIIARIWWYNGSNHILAFDNLIALRFNESNSLNVWHYEIQVFDGFNYSLMYSSIYIGIGGTNPSNDPPSVFNLTLTLNPTTLDSLIANYTYIDGDEDPEFGTQICWYKNGVLQQVYNNTKTIPASATTKGDRWYFAVRPKDVRGAVGVWINSSIVIIINSAPIVLNISPILNSKTTDDLVASWSYFDADNDPQNPNWIIHWYKNNEHIFLYDNDKILPANATTKGEKWYFTLQVFDGFNYSRIYNSSSDFGVVIIIFNTPPVATRINILPADPTTGDNLVANWTYADADNDPQNSHWIIHWYKYGVLITSYDNYTTIDSMYTRKGEVWYYTVWVFDGENYSLEYTSSAIQILDTAPSASNIQITPIIPLRGQSLTVWYNFSDIDVGDTESGTQIYWYRNGMLISSYNNRISIPGNLVFKDDIWNVTIRVSDGTLYGTFVSFSVKIGNTAPTVTVNVSPGVTAFTTDDLLAIYQYSDVDNDPIKNMSVQWEKKNLSGLFIISSLNNITEVPASMTTRNDTWFVIIRVFDGQNWSNYITSVEVRIINSPPTALNSHLSGVYDTNSNITLVYQYFDADNDLQQNLSRIIYWYKNGRLVGTLNDSIYVPASYTTRSEYWQVKFRIFDGNNYSIWYNNTPGIIIPDSAPVITSASINTNATTTYVATGLSVTYTYADADNDRIAPNGIIIYWYMNDTLQPALQNMLVIDKSYLIKGETWYYVILVYDGEIWSNDQASQKITIINTPPKVSDLRFVNTTYFVLETENITVSYTFLDADNDTDHSTIIWYMNDIYQPQYDNWTAIPAVDLLPGEVWYYIILPSDGYATGSQTRSSDVTIESVPHILAYGVEAINDTEGHYLIWFNVTSNPIHPLDPKRPNPTIVFDLLINNSVQISYLTAYYNSSLKLYVFEFRLSDYFKNNYSLLGSPVLVLMNASSAVIYSGNIRFITNSATFNFTLVDTAPPRILSVSYDFDNLTHPKNITFYVQIIDYGSGVSNATLYYYFEPVGNNLSSSPMTNWVFMKGLYYSVNSNEFQTVTLQRLNATYYVVSIRFNNTVDTIVLFQIAVADKAGNINPNAYPLGLNPNRPGARWVVSTGGIPLEQVLMYIAIIVVILSLFSFVIIKKFRKEKLVGLDIDLVLEKADKIREADIIKSMDSHTLGIVISFFDQRHGPIPIMQEPDILRDNFEKLVELSDLSFSTGRFVENFQEEFLLNFDFSVDEQIRVSTVTYAFALDRPQARGGAENITLNILVIKDFYSLISQFTNQFTDIVHKIHQLMNANIQDKTQLQTYLQALRETISSIILAYSELYGTTELLEVEAEAEE